MNFSGAAAAPRETAGAARAAATPAVNIRRRIMDTFSHRRNPACSGRLFQNFFLVIPGACSRVRAFSVRGGTVFVMGRPERANTHNIVSMHMARSSPDRYP
jgi:hypothetical protein